LFGEENKLEVEEDGAVGEGLPSGEKGHSMRKT
jgi:hypothetical protein